MPRGRPGLHRVQWGVHTEGDIPLAYVAGGGAGDVEGNAVVEDAGTDSCAEETPKTRPVRDSSVAMWCVAAWASVVITGGRVAVRRAGKEIVEA